MVRNLSFHNPNPVNPLAHSPNSTPHHHLSLSTSPLSGMKVVALISGGKDSCYAMMRCVDYGHEIVALANLMPADESVDDLDSYMYQTVGHQILVGYAECMGLPLFRRRIRGSTRHKHLGYRMTPGDEVEDMFLLLKEVKEKIPSITAVSSGAIASDYQRLRVENVCSRLGLVSLSYLWKQDQTLLLQEMLRRGVAAITIKVAALGLVPERHLGKHIAELHDLLLRLKERYGINVCGEGGEYETLTLDCPLFTNARIVLDDFELVLHSTDSIAPAGILHPLFFHLERRVENFNETDCRKGGSVYEVDGEAISTQVNDGSEDYEMAMSCASGMNGLRVSARKGCFSIACWNQSRSSNGLEEDLTVCLSRIGSRLGECGCGWANVLYVHLYISDMDSFGLANDVYLRFITENECFLGVPSRSCVELPLEHAGLGNSYVEVMVADDCSKKVLHVQSISCWAPSCIGPYSQATLHKEILYMAGQLGLDPPTMKLCSGGPTAELKQALENCESVSRIFKSSIASGILLVVYCSASVTSSVRLDIQHVVENFVRVNASNSQEERWPGAPDPILLYIVAPALPRRAYVEVKPFLYVPETVESNASIHTTKTEGHPQMPQNWCLEFSGITDSCTQEFVIPGRICTSVISITSHVAAELCSVCHQHAPDFSCYKRKTNITRLSRFSVYLLHKTLMKNNFSWVELMSLRIYFAISHIPIDMLRSAICDAFMELAMTIDGVPKITQESIVSLVPVVGAGKDADMKNLVTCELFASKL